MVAQIPETTYTLWSDNSRQKCKPTFANHVSLLQFAIRTTIRNNNTMKRDDVIKQVADAVGTRHSVDLTNYDLLIIVDIYRVLWNLTIGRKH